MIEIIRSEMLEKSGFPLHGFTKRNGGVSEGGFATLNFAFNVGDDSEHVVENLSRLKAQLDIDAPLVRVDQIHSNKVISASECGPDYWDKAPDVEADGIIGNTDDGLLAVQVSDCAPVLLASPSTRTVAAIHAGWRGVARGVIKNGVRAMRDRGISPSEIVAAIGPCACGKCYEVGEEVARHFPESSDKRKGKPGKYLLDLGLAIEVSLIGAGLRGENIDRIDACTICMEQELFSRRRDGELCGRLLGFISG